MSEYDYEGHTANNMSRPTETSDFFSNAAQAKMSIHNVRALDVP